MCLLVDPGLSECDKPPEQVGVEIRTGGIPAWAPSVVSIAYIKNRASIHISQRAVGDDKETYEGRRDFLVFPQTNTFLRRRRLHRYG